MKTLKFMINFWNKVEYLWSCGGAKAWALAVGLSTTFYQQCVRGEEIIGKPLN